MPVPTDFLIIGSGIAGLRAAADLATAGKVLVLTKADPEESNTGYAQGGIAVAIGADDTPALHAEDTIAAGDGLCDESAVRILVEEGVRYVRELVSWGARVDRDASGELALGREGAHRVRRVLHAADATGREIGRVLWERVSAEPRIRVLRHTRAISLLIRDNRCTGARFVGPNGEATIEAQATLLATGGAGQIYAETTNPPVATGDGVALAWRAGARVADLEFMQFHPTVLSVPGAPRFLLSEAIRGEGAWLVNAEGERFMLREGPAGELASRDVVSRAIVQETARTGSPVFLTLQHLEPSYIAHRFPMALAACRAAGLDLARHRIPVSPAAHYQMGGVETDVSGRTTIAGLLAAGEVACTGVHGANRLASNSLLEGLVFGARAAQVMLEPPRASQMANVREAEPREKASVIGVTDAMGGTEWRRGTSISEADIRDLMWRRVGVTRDGPGLEGAVRYLLAWHEEAEQALAADPHDMNRWRFASLLTVSALMARAALRREESRGAHYRADFPARNDIHWQVHIAERRGA
ncbi:MAG: L-aspartate oxidase [Vicinamibacterales bacterium]